MRMDKYDDKVTHEDEKILSRTQKNQEMYDELYLNNQVVDINKILPPDEKEEEKEEPVEEEKKIVYEEKNYSVEDYLKKAHEKQVDDKAMRSLDNSEFQNREEEIVKLIASIDEKEKDMDIFDDLRGDDENTMVKGVKTNEFDVSIYEALQDEREEHDTFLEKIISDNTMMDLEKEENDKMDHTFEKIMESDRKIASKKKQLPIIVFCITLFMLIFVILIVLLFH